MRAPNVSSTSSMLASACTFPSVKPTADDMLAAIKALSKYKALNFSAREFLLDYDVDGKLTESETERLLGELVDAGELEKLPDGSRATGGNEPRRIPARYRRRP